MTSSIATSPQPQPPQSVAPPSVAFEIQVKKVRFFFHSCHCFLSSTFISQLLRLVYSFSQQEQLLNVNDSSPPVQKRLAAQAHSPRKDISLDDINTKLEQANKRKEENLASVTSKTVAHNARVEQVYEQSKEKETHKIKALEEHITSKLDNAEAKRDDTKSSWVSEFVTMMFMCRL